MEVIYWLIPIVLIFGLFVVIVFIWMAKQGQFDDLDGAAHSIFILDDEYPEPPKQVKENKDIKSQTDK